MYKLSKRSLRRLEGIKKILTKIAKEAIKDSPHDFGIPLTGGLRTAEDQNKLYRQKVSKCDGYKKKSYHQTGKAFDIYVIIDGKATWQTKYYKPVAKHIIKVARDKFSVELTWGGNFKSFTDLPHFEIGR